MAKWKKAHKKSVIVEFREPKGVEIIKTREGVLTLLKGKIMLYVV